MDNRNQKTVVITGGSRGIGRSVALRFAEDRPRIIIAHYDPDEVEANKTLDELAQRGVIAEGHKIDVSSFEPVASFFKNILSKYEKIDVLVNNAGITRDALLMRMTEDEWDTVIRVNLKSVFNCTHAVVRSMIKKRGGCICNIASVVGQTGNAGQANYAASKAGIMGFTKTVAKEVAPRGITVNAIAPGLVDTEMTTTIPKPIRDQMVQKIPLRRMGSVKDIAALVCYLASDEADYIQGEVIEISGGFRM